MFDSCSTAQHRRTAVPHPLAGTAVHMFHLQNEHTIVGLDVFLSTAVSTYHVWNVTPGLGFLVGLHSAIPSGRQVKSIAAETFRVAAPGHSAVVNPRLAPVVMGRVWLQERVREHSCSKTTAKAAGA